VVICSRLTRATSAKYKRACVKELSTKPKNRAYCTKSH